MSEAMMIACTAYDIDPPIESMRAERWLFGWDGETLECIDPLNEHACPRPARYMVEADGERFPVCEDHYWSSVEEVFDGLRLDHSAHGWQRETEVYSWPI